MQLVSKIIKLEDLNKGEYNSYLLKDEKTLLYSSYEYMTMLSSFLASKAFVIIVYNSDKIVGVMPFVLKENQRYGNVCNSLPFYGSNGGMVVDECESKNAIRKLIINEFEQFTLEHKCISSTIISNPLDEDSNTWLKENFEHSCIDQRIGQITHLPKATNDDYKDQLMRSFEDPRPRNIRKAIKDGVKIHSSNSQEAIDFLYKVHYENITAIKGIPKEKSFFDILPTHFNNDQFRIYLATHNGELIAALLLFFFNKTVEYFTPAVVEKYRNSQPTALIIYEAMIDSVEKGYKNWNWGGTWLSQGGVYDFKKKWGTTDYRYFYYTKIADSSVSKMSRETLLSEYPYFFVIPFSALKNE